MRSSYAENNFGSILRALILAQLPRLVIECGVLDGYSAFHIAHALRFNAQKMKRQSEFIAYDLWEEYRYKHGNFNKVASMLREQNLLNKHVNLHYGNAFNVYSYYQDGAVDFLHMDISNDGDILRKTIDHWGPKIAHGGIIAFEGGSVERDNVEWMKKYDRNPIAPEVVNISFDTEFDAQVFPMFPSMTLFFKR
jgi:predicted O-methyltransferase YrrM